MKKGTIKSLAVSGGGNHIFRQGDKVTEKNFPEGTFNQHVKDGHITPDKEEKQKTVSEVTDLLAKMDGFGDIDALIAGDDRKGVKDAAEARKTEIRESSESDAQKANQEKAKKAKADVLVKIENAKTVGAIKAILAGQTDEDIMKAGGEKVDALDAEKKAADEKKEADKKAEESKSEEKTEEPKSEEKTEEPKTEEKKK